MLTYYLDAPSFCDQLYDKPLQTCCPCWSWWPPWPQPRAPPAPCWAPRTGPSRPPPSSSPPSRSPGTPPWPSAVSEVRVGHRGGEFNFQLLVTEHSKHSLMWNEDIQRISVTLSPLYRLKCSPDNIDIPASYAPNCQKMMRTEFLCGKSGNHMLSCFLFFSKSSD